MATMTEAQYVTLAQDITVTNAVEFAEELAATDDQAIATAYNLQAAPDYWVWRTSLRKEAILFATSVTGTTFNFKGNGFVGRSIPELLSWQELFSINNTVNPSLATVQVAFDDIFSGTGNAADNRVHIDAVSRRLVTRLERLFAIPATMPGSSGAAGSPTNPGWLVVEGTITYFDVAHALRGVPI